MKVQTFDQDGVLVEETELGVSYPSDINGFITQMMLDSGYQQLVLTSPPAMIARLEMLMIRLESRPIVSRADLEVIKSIWNNITANFLEDSEDVSKWNELASCHNIPFSFNNEGEIEINADFQ